MNDRTPLLPGDWGDLSPLVDRLLDTPLSERSALLDAMAGDDPGRRATLERLVAECERDLPLLEGPAIERFARLLQEDTGPPLPEMLGGRYRIERELGRGGMARVYLAQDVRHGRPVAVKVIRHEIAASLGRDRFLREIGIAARLRHPNIMPLYDSGDVDGLLYFVMPYEEGKSLRVRLDAGERLGVAEAVSILRDVARALACAHEQGVVHRDIKPDNVLLSGGAAVVTDFGIAKALTVAAVASGTGPVTQAGTVIGTPAYMSPEQAMGDPATDHRTDIYAFGCLAYEVFAGAPPFTGATTYQILSAQISEPPKPLADRRPDTPEAVARLIARCLEKDPDSRPAGAAQLLEALGTPAEARVPAVASRRPPRRLVAALLGLGVILLAGGYAAWATRGGPVTIAVLPLEVIGDSAQPVGGGFGQDLATELVRFRWLLVKSRGGAVNYRGRGDLDPRAVSDSLGVRYLVMGSLRREGNANALTLRLVRGEDDAVVWADKFPQMADLQTLRDQIARSIADALRPAAARFASRFPVNPTPRPQVRSDAYTLYLMGKTKVVQRGRSIKDGIALFRQAIELDSTSAAAWSGLSLALAISLVSQQAPIDSLSPEAIASAERALRLDPTLSEPHVALAVVHALYWRWGEAEAAFKTALDRNPHDVEARIQYARVLHRLNRYEDATRQIEAARDDDPASSLVMGFKAMAHFYRDELDSAVVWSDRAIQSDPANSLARIFRGMLLLRLNRPLEARRLVQGSGPYEPYSLYVLAASGDTATIRQRLAELAGGKTGVPMIATAQAYAYLGLGDTAQALDAFERATDRREIWPNISPVELPAFDAVRESPRFWALLRRVGLTAP